MSAKASSKKFLPSFICRLFKRRKSDVTPHATQIQCETNHAETTAPTDSVNSNLSSGLVYEIDISDMPDYTRCQLSLPPRAETNMVRVDAQEMAIAELNFPGPLGYHFDPSDPQRPDEYGLRICTEGPMRGIIAMEQVASQDQNCDDDVDPPLPSYNWATISTLPLPVKIKTKWASLYAAQREKSQLLAVQEYTSTRIAEINAQTGSIIREKKKQISVLELRYIAQSSIEQLRRVLDQPTYGDLVDNFKVNFVRERLSPVSLFAHQPWDLDLEYRSPPVVPDGATRY